MFNNHYMKRDSGTRRPDLRKFKDTYVTQLHRVPNGAMFRHCAEDIVCVKESDARQHKVSDPARSIVFARGDLVEVLK